MTPFRMLTVNLTEAALRGAIKTRLLIGRGIAIGRTGFFVVRLQHVPAETMIQTFRDAGCVARDMRHDNTDATTAPTVH